MNTIIIVIIITIKIIWMKFYDRNYETAQE